MGGPDSFDSVVEGCRIEDPRGWTGVSVLTLSGVNHAAVHRHLTDSPALRPTSFTCAILRHGTASSTTLSDHVVKKVRGFAKQYAVASRHAD